MSSQPIVQVQNISKRYNLGTIGAGSLKQELNFLWQKYITKKDNPFFGLSSETASGDSKRNSFWALKNVSFDVNEGEVWGIVGHNGAGKSTLLKILSRIILPTEGVITGRGRISSLLEVGAGFQPELTGKENIFTSGYILGMTKKEVTKKFDEIVAFSGVEAFLDTPVKRYSSGMYMRLAFSVAAHLEPDILIIDEVLAVGDAEFQQKCLGKMQDVSEKQGRTIIFVSHNLQAVANLCDKALWLEKGVTKQIGSASEIVTNYLTSVKSGDIVQKWDDIEKAPGNELLRLKEISVKNEANNGFITIESPVSVIAEFWNEATNCTLEACIRLYSTEGVCIFDIGSSTIEAEKGAFSFKATIPPNLLNDKRYSVSLVIFKNNSQPLCEFPDCVRFDVQDMREDEQYFGDWGGVIRPKLQIDFSRNRKTDSSVSQNKASLVYSKTN